MVGERAGKPAGTGPCKPRKQLHLRRRVPDADATDRRTRVHAVTGRHGTSLQERASKMKVGRYNAEKVGQPRARAGRHGALPSLPAYGRASNEGESRISRRSTQFPVRLESWGYVVRFKRDEVLERRKAQSADPRDHGGHPASRGLGYQVVWTQQERVVLGHESAAGDRGGPRVLGGMALGSFAFGARIERSRRPGGGMRDGEL